MKGKNTTLFGANPRTSNASPKLRALCATSMPAGAEHTIAYQSQRLATISKDKDTKIFRQEGRTVTEV